MLPITLTVIIPTYNRPDLICRAIDSVLVQHIENIEIIVVDDGNDKKTAELLAIYIVQSKIHYILNDTGCHGPASARNFGAYQALGEFITFLDDDDIYLPGRLTNMLSMAQKDRFIFISSGRFLEIDDFSTIKCSKNQLSGIIKLEHIIYRNDIDIGFMIKRVDFIKIGGFDSELKTLEDWDLVLRMLMIGDGYKMNRLDYAVNTSPNLMHVSSSDSIGYNQLANKHRDYFGEKWFSFMITMAAVRKDKFSLISTLRLSMMSKTILPIKIYAKYKLRALRVKWIPPSRQ